MKKYLLNPLLLILLVILGAYITHALKSPSTAPNNPAMPPPPPPGQRPRVAVFPFGIKPTSDKQQAALDKIDEKYRKEVWEARENLNNVLTPQQRQNRQEAFQKAIKEGKTGKELGEAVEKTLGVTSEQRENLLKASTKLSSISAAMMSEVLALLTDEQKKQIEEKRSQLMKNQSHPVKPPPTKPTEEPKTKSEPSKKTKASDKKK